MSLLPALREDLQLSEAPPALDGSRQWTLADTLAGRYYKLNDSAMRLLRHWALGEATAVIDAANRQPGPPLGQAELQSFLLFLRGHELIAADAEQRASFPARAAQRRHGLLKSLLHQYLFFRIPLWRPDPFLNRCWPWLDKHGPWLLRGLFPLLLLAGVFLVSRDWPRYRDAFPQLFDLAGAAAFGAALLVAKFIHELGHAFMARRAGCRVQSMGVAFVVMLPMFYTDVSDAWRVKSARSRLLIGSGGIMAELLLAVVALLAWSLLPDGALRSAAFMLSGVTWITTLAINLNPLMRFDGYFLLSDLWQVDNLQPRAFALCRWHLRERLFGYGEAPPQRWSPVMQRRLLLWGYASWLWRFFLFLGIAFTVYHYFFKLLGMMLMMVEILWFIALPVWRELQHWWRQRQHAHPLRLLRSGLLFVLLLLVLFVPWRSRVNIPAVLEASQMSTLYAPVAAQVVQLHVRNHQQVAAGTLLLALQSPDLDARQHIVRLEIARLQLQLRRLAARQDTVGESQVVEQQLAEALAQYRGLALQRQRLELRAPQAGEVRDIATDLTPGRWVSGDEALLRLVSAGQGRINGYLAEEHLHSLHAGQSGRFIADDPAWPAVTAQLRTVDPTGSAFISEEALTSDHGGPLAVRRDEQNRAQPLQAAYGVIFTPPPGTAQPPQPLRGVVVMSGESESLFSALWRRIAVLGVRESGF